MLREFFLAHMPEIYFFYGLSFIIMAVTITIQVQQYPHSKFSKNLWLLAVFGYLHGPTEWSYFYIPYKEGDWPSWAVFTLEIIDLNLVAISFGFLLIFGLSFLNELKEHAVIKKLIYVSVVLIIVWVSYFTFYRIILLGNNPEFWVLLAETSSRYVLGFTGGVTAGAAVYLYSQKIKSNESPGTTVMYKLLAFSFAAYGILAGMIVTPMNFFPVSIINKDLFFQVFNAPVPLFRAFFTLIIAICILYILWKLQHETIALINKTSSENAVLLERERIKKDLHDDIIQSIYAVGLELVNCKSHIEEDPLESKNKLDRAIDDLNKVISNLRLYIEDLKSAEYVSLTIIEVVEKLVEKFKPNINIRVINNLPSNKDTHPDLKANLFHILGELLINSLKHSDCNLVTLELRQKNNKLEAKVTDNGIGIDLSSLRKKQKEKEKMGLFHIQERVNAIGGIFKIDNVKPKGTKVELEIPLL